MKKPVIQCKPANYPNGAPVLTSRGGNPVALNGLYRGSSAFLVCGGPSLIGMDLKLLHQRGIVTMGVNNSAAVFKPNLWVCVDSPGNFSDAIWYDPSILKFVPKKNINAKFTVRNEYGELVTSPHKLADLPSIVCYERNSSFNPDTFLTEKTFNWGNTGGRKDKLGNTGSRSVMYVAIRMLHYLGFRTIYLVGCDFKMAHGKQNYAFPQDRSESSVRNNNNTYRIMNSRFDAMKNHFAEAGLKIYNCTPNSGLKSFPYKDFKEAVAEATNNIPYSIETKGMYDRGKSKQKVRQQGKQTPKPAPIKAEVGTTPKIAVITPTSNRPMAFSLCEYWMQRQTYTGEIQWIVSEDGTDPLECRLGQTHVRNPPPRDPQRSFCQNILNALKHVEADYVVVMEDDDWYHPDYLMKQVERLKTGCMVAGEGGAKYYNLHSQSWKLHHNYNRASLCQTAFRAEAIPWINQFLTKRCTKFLDIHLWKKHSHRVIEKESTTTIGIKGIPGKINLALGNAATSKRCKNHDPEWAMLRKWIGDDVEIYIDLMTRFKAGTLPPDWRMELK